MSELREFFSTLLRSKSPALLSKVQGISPEDRVRHLDEIEAAEFLRQGARVKPYPEKACMERDRLRRMGREERRKTIERSEYDAGMLHLGRKEYAAWYSLVRTDLEVLEHTIVGVGAPTPTGQKLARLLLALAEQYAVIPAPWPRDRAHPDGAPCTLPEYHQRRARKWITPLRVVRGGDSFFDRPEALL